MNSMTAHNNQKCQKILTRLRNRLKTENENEIKLYWPLVSGKRQEVLISKSDGTGTIYSPLPEIDLKSLKQVLWAPVILFIHLLECSNYEFSPETRNLFLKWEQEESRHGLPEYIIFKKVLSELEFI